MRNVSLALIITLQSSSAFALEPGWCVHEDKQNRLQSLAYSFDVEFDGISCARYMKPVFEIKQTAPNTCVFQWWLNIQDITIPGVSFEANHQMDHLLVKLSQTELEQSYCYQGVDSSYQYKGEDLIYQTFSSCGDDGDPVYSDWVLLEQHLSDLEYVRFNDHNRVFDNGLFLQRENLYQAYIRFQEETGCPAMF
ncbi:hypothetical protein NeNHUV3_10850 [Nereida sp. NH-UV-3]